jgi:hypothetical protein
VARAPSGNCGAATGAALKALWVRRALETRISSSNRDIESRPATFNSKPTHKRFAILQSLAQTPWQTIWTLVSARKLDLKLHDQYSDVIYFATKIKKPTLTVTMH